MHKWKFYLCGAALLVSLPLNTSAPALPKEPEPIVQKAVIAVASSSLPTLSITAKVTMYSGVESCHYENCVMASGKRAYIGAVACPRKYKLGTKVEIAGNTYTCEDRTATRYDGRFDIFAGYSAEAYKKAIQWGIKTLPVSIL